MNRYYGKVTGGWIRSVALTAFVVLSLAACSGVSDSTSLQSGLAQSTAEMKIAGGVRYHRMNRPQVYRGYGFQGMGTLPTGRRTWQGRYFGNINNRYYGPQYGYF